MTNKKKIFIFHHLGLGDHFHCNGIVRILYKKHINKNNIYLIVEKKFSHMVKEMFSDLKKLKYKTIKLGKATLKDRYFNKHEIVQQIVKDKNSNLIKIGHEFLYKNFKLINKIYTCDMLFYKQMDIPYKIRHEGSFWKRNKLKENKLYNKLIISKKYAFIHDDPSRGYVIDDKVVSKGLSILRNNNKVNILHYGKILENASEIHLMESSIRCMIESLKIKSKKNNIYRFINGPWKSMPFYRNKKIIGSKIKWKFKKLNFHHTVLGKIKKIIKSFL
tara:strand:- start:20 stop:844 length:825 start_codon:yes stop_codon:yes gene_type:complete